MLNPNEKINTLSDFVLKSYITEQIIKLYECFDQSFTEKSLTTCCDLFYEAIRKKFNHLPNGSIINFFDRMQFGDIKIKKISVVELTQAFRVEYHNVIMKQEDVKKETVLKATMENDNCGVLKCMSFKLLHFGTAETYGNTNLHQIREAMLVFGKNMTIQQFNQYLSRAKC